MTLERGTLARIGHLYGFYLAPDDQEPNQALGAFVELWQQQELAEFLPVVDAFLQCADEIFNLHHDWQGRVSTGGSKAA